MSSDFKDDDRVGKHSFEWPLTHKRVAVTCLVLASFCVLAVTAIVVTLVVPANRDTAFFAENRNELELAAVWVFETTASQRPAPTDVVLRLPKDMRHLSDSGSVWFTAQPDRQVTFWRFRGLLGQGRGFLYWPHETPPLAEIAEMYDYAEQLDERWFLVEDYD
ncbi:MAG: hypothetical protein M1617_00705 [Actinobacteria bacterium]|nr:hypothetical protein [Actinomycetota bacterium]MCL5886816.1 hypothetical protein [Actinomycetota bacterium]